MDNSLQKIDSLCKQLTPFLTGYSGKSPTGTTQAELDIVEQSLGHRLPEALKFMLLLIGGTDIPIEITLGHSAEPVCFVGFFPCSEWAGLSAEFKAELEYWNQEFAEKSTVVVGSVKKDRMAFRLGIVFGRTCLSLVL